MSRRNKIIVSVVGVIIITLALLGITYGYFLTRIVGNTNTNSISITTANLRLVYRDGTPEVLTATNIQPGNTVYTKTFTVTNEGNASIDYEVYLENVINDFVHEEDLLMFVTCESNITGNTCNGFGDGSVTDDTPTFGTSIYPTVNSKLISNTIEPASEGVDAEVHTYTLYLMFRDDSSDQSDDMGKTLQGKIQIYDPKDVVAISGKVTDAEGNVPEDATSYYVELHSDVKTSQVASDGSYIFYGVGTETHTIYIKKNVEGTVSDIGNSTITVTKGDTASITGDASNIVINDDSYNATVNITIPESNNSVTLTGVSVKEYNPFDETSLAYQIYQNKALIDRYEKNVGDYEDWCIDDAEFVSMTPEEFGCEKVIEYAFKDTITNKNVKELTTVTGVADGTNVEDNGLFYADDDYGTSYIYRGSVINNYVDFAGFTWRIVRINGDGSVRLILDGTLDKVKQRLSDGTLASNYAGSTSAFNSSFNDNAYVGYTYGQVGVTAGNGTKTAYDLTHEYTGDKTNTEDKTGQSTIKQAVDTFYKTHLLDDYNSYISDTLFCGDKSLAKSGIGNVTTQLGYGTNKTYYAATERLYYSSGTTSIIEATPTLKCVPNNTSLTEDQKAYSRYTVSGNSINGIKTNDDLIYPIALLSADELVMSGAFVDIKNQQYYLYNSFTTLNSWWTMSPNYFDGSDAFEFTSYVSSNSRVNGRGDYFYTYGVRPVINLSAEVLYDSGVGTSESPYTVKLSET